MDTPAPTTINPSALYTAKEAAAWLRMSNYRAIYEISEAELPQCRVGPKRGRIRYMGADLLCYARGIKPIDIKGALEELRSRISRPGPRVLPMNGNGVSRRVL